MKQNLKTRMSGREVGSPVAQDLVGRGVRAECPAHCDDRMLRCSHPMRAAAENFIRVFFLGHLVEKTIMKYSHPQLVYSFFTFQ